MAKLELRTASITTVAELIRKKEISPVEVIDAFLQRIGAVQKRINAFITVLDREAREAARLTGVRFTVFLSRPKTFSLQEE